MLYNVQHHFHSPSPGWKIVNLRLTAFPAEGTGNESAYVRPG